MGVRVPQRTRSDVNKQQVRATGATTSAKAMQECAAVTQSQSDHVGELVTFTHSIVSECPN